MLVQKLLSAEGAFWGSSLTVVASAYTPESWKSTNLTTCSDGSVLLA